MTFCYCGFVRFGYFVTPTSIADVARFTVFDMDSYPGIRRGYGL